jgi:hypothetical protein
MGQKWLQPIENYQDEARCAKFVTTHTTKPKRCYL